jgi:hypothetical protein
VADHGALLDVLEQAAPVDEALGQERAALISCTFTASPWS